MNNKQNKILRNIFKRPALSNIKWKDIESLMVNIGCEIKNGNGSRIRFAFKKEVATFHKPHPYPNTAKGAVEGVRDFLIKIGVKYDIKI